MPPYKNHFHKCITLAHFTLHIDGKSVRPQMCAHTHLHMHLFTRVCVCACVVHYTATDNGKKVARHIVKETMQSKHKKKKNNMKENQTQLNAMKKIRSICNTEKKKWNTQMQYGNPLVNEPLQLGTGSNLKIYYTGCWFNFHCLIQCNFWIANSSSPKRKWESILQYLFRCVKWFQAWNAIVLISH